MATTDIPVIATGDVFAKYLTAARQNLDALVRLSAALKDDEFTKAAQRILDGFDADAVDALFLIGEASEGGTCEDQFWRDSECARAHGMDEFAGVVL